MTIWQDSHSTLEKEMYTQGIDFFYLIFLNGVGGKNRLTAQFFADHLHGQALSMVMSVKHVGITFRLCNRI